MCIIWSQPHWYVRSMNAVPWIGEELDHWEMWGGVVWFLLLLFAFFSKASPSDFQYHFHCGLWEQSHCHSVSVFPACSAGHGCWRTSVATWKLWRKHVLQSRLSVWDLWELQEKMCINSLSDRLCAAEHWSCTNTVLLFLHKCPCTIYFELLVSWFGCIALVTTNQYSILFWRWVC